MLQHCLLHFCDVGHATIGLTNSKLLGTTIYPLYYLILNTRHNKYRTKHQWRVYAKWRPWQRLNVRLFIII